MKIVFIKWIDSKSGSFEWEYLDEIESLKPVVCKSIGFLIEDNREFKTIAPTIGGGQVLGRITIPTCSIINYRIVSR